MNEVGHGAAAEGNPSGEEAKTDLREGAGEEFHTQLHNSWTVEQPLGPTWFIPPLRALHGRGRMCKLGGHSNGSEKAKETFQSRL